MMKPTLQLRIGQQLTMTPQLQQAIRLLQLPALELQAQVQEALENNVMLEADDGPEGMTSLDALAESAHPDERNDEGRDDGDEGGDAAADEPVVEIGDEWNEPTAAESESPGPRGSGDRMLDIADESGQTLQDHLVWQLAIAGLPERTEAIGRAIADAINDDGYLTESLDDIAAALRPEVDARADEVEAALRVVQALDPPGVGARSVAECIGLQLALLDPATPGRDCALALARDHLELVASQQMGLLQRQARCSEEELVQALALVRACHPRPGSVIQNSRTEYIVPDVYVHRTPQGWAVELNGAALPRVRVNETYAGMLTRAADHAVMRAQLQEARWLMRSLEIRNETMLKVARCIVERQCAFLERGEEAMEPMILRDVAEAVEMHESTISRVTTGKYMHTPRGVYEFRFFFSSQVAADDGTGVSSTAIRAKMKKLVAHEDPAEPLSDARIAELLSEDGVKVARRTVAKYREALGIPSSNDRRQARPA